MSDLSDFKRVVYEPEVAALRRNLSQARAERDRAHQALRDAQGFVVDFSEGRLDPLVALGKIGLRILEVTG